jgi:ankyrin repeat protein
LLAFSKDIESRVRPTKEEAVVKLLLDMGKVDVDAKDSFGQTPLSWAAEKGVRSHGQAVAICRSFIGVCSPS